MGVVDILIACTGNLKGFSNAVKESFPQAITRLYIVHQICKYTKIKVQLTDDQAAQKAVYLAVINIQKKEVCPSTIGGTYSISS